MTVQRLDPPAQLGADEGLSKRAGGKQPQSSLLVELAQERYRFGRSTTGEVFAYQPVFSPVARMLRGGRDSLRAELAALFAQRYGRAPSASALADCMLVLEGLAQREPATELSLRVAQKGGHVYLDLGTDDCQVVLLSGDGWRATFSVEMLPVRFRRSELTAPLPLPERGGRLEALREFLNVSDESWPLVVAFLVAAFFVEIPHPILLFTGEQGVGKSTAGRTLVSIIDPSPAPLRSSPKDVEEWAVTAAGSWLVGIDNVSTISPWFSDALCRAVTADGLVRRRLYSDSDITVLAIRRVVVLTSIDPGALRGDLADRLLPVELQRLDSKTRRTEEDLERSFDEARAGILGGLLDLTAKVLARLPDVALDDYPRMADFARVLAAVDAELGTNGLATYRGLAARLAADIVESDAVASAVCRFLEGRDGRPWTGTATELLHSLEVDPKPRGWPADGTRLSGRLRRAAPALRSVGVEVEQQRQAGGSRRRLLTVRARDAGGDANRDAGDAGDAVQRPPEGAGQPVDRDAGTARDAEIPFPLCSTEEGEREREGDSQTASLASLASPPLEDPPWLDSDTDVEPDDWGEW